MSRPEVWAPHAGAVDIEIDGRLVAAEPGDGGWFRAPFDLGDGDYTFRLDGGEPLPDPRSRWQPHGVHGASRPFDPDAHTWTDQGFAPVPLADAIIYELHVGTFSRAGTFAGVRAHLDHLVDLGVTHLELMPINAFAGRHGWGYDGVDLFAPHPAYGPPAALQELVDACHARGLAVLLDVVYNHLGPDGNHLSRFGPYFTDRYSTPWGEAVNLDGPGSDEVRRFFLDNARLWLRDFHLDGLRLDAMHTLIDTSAVHWIEALRLEIDDLGKETGRTYVLTAESEGNDPRLVRGLADGGLGLDALWNDDVHHALHTSLTDQRDSYYEDYDGLVDLAAALTEGFVYAGRYSPHRDRQHGRPFVGRDADALVACLQNHDQVGNRAAGERATHLMSAGRQRVGAALLLTSPFVPLLFQGEEWATSAPFPYFADHDDPALADAVRRGRQAEFARFGWHPDEVADPEDLATFLDAKLPWEEVATGPHAAMLAWYGELIALRHREPDLRDPHLALVAVAVDPVRGSIVVRRGRLVIAANLGAAPLDLDLAPGDDQPVTVAISSSDQIHVQGGGVHLPPDEIVICRHPLIR